VIYGRKCCHSSHSLVEGVHHEPLQP
jgi:hypothetical protein